MTENLTKSVKMSFLELIAGILSLRVFKNNLSFKNPNSFLTNYKSHSKKRIIFYTILKL